mmetsp:Transcript_8872/g.24858  ORF Transcript_8872/g.24858 Transcript_8872/m.24858 type:complete len:369 (-) Transcript_8872:144-1250(-)
MFGARAPFNGATSGFWNSRTATPVAEEACGAGDACGAACDNSCAGIAGICLEPAGASTTERWLFVGDGKGAYAPVKNYNFVGKGAGTHDLVASLRSSWMSWLLPCILLALAIPFLGWIFSSATESFAHKAVFLNVHRGPRFNCSIPRVVPDEASFEVEWLDVDRDRDGHVTGHELAAADDRGQMSRGALQALFRADHDGGGTLDRKEFTAALRGVLGAVTSTNNDTATPAVLTWTAAKRLWCCENAGVMAACRVPLLAATTAPPRLKRLAFDCYAGYSDWRHAWSRRKREWCCQHLDRGCVQATTSHAACKGWCCELVGRSCNHTTTTQPYDCQAGLSNYRRGWSHSKLRWCCRRLPQLSCPDDEHWI